MSQPDELTKEDVEHTRSKLMEAGTNGDAVHLTPQDVTVVLSLLGAYQLQLEQQQQRGLHLQQITHSLLEEMDAAEGTGVVEIPAAAWESDITGFGITWDEEKDALVFDLSRAEQEVVEGEVE